MGLLRAGIGAAVSVLKDEWREYFYCDALRADVLVKRGRKRTSGNNKGDDNIISDGSIIAVNEGQCMMIVDQGKVVEVCAEAGEFVFDNKTQPSIFAGDLGDAVMRSFNEAEKRFTFAGDTAGDQRVYFFNTKEITGNKFGTPNPIPFRVTDKNIGLDIDISIRTNGEYSYRICNPMQFYTNVCANVTDTYTRDGIDSTLKSELLTALQPAMAKISAMGIRYSELPAHTSELATALNDELSNKWTELRGLTISSMAINSVSATKEDEDMIKQLQKSAVMRDPSMAAAALVSAQSDAMRSAAQNEGGALNGFIGMGMAQSAGGMNAKDLFAMGQNTGANTGAAAAEGWQCACGAMNTGKFCSECGKPRPAAESSWQCACGAVNTGKFCSECGKPKA